MTQNYRLHYAPDNASLIIRLALEEMNLPYETLLVDRSVSAQRRPDYLALNPAGKIPTLETPDGVISEVGAILSYLSETHGQMAPQAGHAGRPEFLKWLFFTANTLHPDLIMQFYAHRYGPQEAMDHIRALTAQRLRDHLALLDQALRHAPWSSGETPSVLDYYVVACLRWATLYPVGETGWFKIADYPHLFALCQQLETRPAAQAAIKAEGLGQTPFSAPHYANPPEGVAL
ncbi:glutathione S-transferase [Epibacterium sp. SM1979]|uniref:Glutathione S-transferase n=1 Tax=Tritonibacter litoralis TaxID=2662264 RepID=A0A843YF15_9RHOB|nr:glutathione S-transferase family protein [Tritonibacter litoralis]MQQ07872.1 glutathione S-transferase [Tritonibacter litoralis]